MHGRDQIARLRQVDFPSRIELVARTLALVLGGTVLAMNGHWIQAVAWLVGYFGVMAVYWRFLTTRGAEPTDRDVTIASSLFLLLLIAFIWLPVLAMMQPGVPMVFTAAAAYSCMLIFLIWRAETSLCIIGGTVAIVLAAHLLLLNHYLTLVDSMPAQVIMVVAALASVAYLAQAMLVFRLRERIADRRARRSAQAQKFEAVGQLAGGIAHEFNNMLTAMQGNLELVSVIEDESERRALIGEAHAASLRAANLVRQLLSYARSARMTPTRVSVLDVFDSTENSARQFLPAAISLTMVRPQTDLFTETDAGQLAAVLVQLMANARDAMPNGGTIRVEAEPLSEGHGTLLPDGSFLAPGPYVAIAVADTGHGIPRELIGRITDPFFTTKPVGMGSGMGLAVAAGFARQSGGGLRICSSDKGTTVTLLLPELRPDDPSADGTSDHLRMASLG